MLSDTDLACISLALVFCADKKTKKRRWMKDWYKKRHLCTHENLLKDLKFSEPDDFRNILQMDDAVFDDLLEMVAPLVEKQNTVMRESIPARQRLSVTLTYLATGNTFEDLKFSSAISPQSISNIVLETCEAIIHSLKGYIQLPKTQDEWKEIANGFKERWNFPNCIGAIDGNHMEIKKPPHTGSFYYNYKNSFSIVLMAIVNSKYEFLMTDVGINGRLSDGGVFRETKFGRLFKYKSLQLPEPQCLPNSVRKLPFVFVAGDAFVISENLMKPYAQSKLDVKKQIFNYRLSRARCIVENAFGIVVSRFGVLQRPIHLRPEKAQVLVLTCCYLHNLLARKTPSSYICQGSVDIENLETGKIEEASWRSNVQLINLQKNCNGNSTDLAQKIRDSYCEYFNCEGRVMAR